MPALRTSTSRARVSARTRVAAAAVAAASTAAALVTIAAPASATVPSYLQPMAPRSVAPGQIFAVQARLTHNGYAVVGRRVTYEWRASNTDTWHALATVTTSSTGLASLNQRLTASRQYAMRFFGDSVFSPTPWVGTLITVSTLGQRAVTEASRHYGAPYQYGAAGPYRFDCSGLTQYVYRRVGRLLPRTAADQYFHTQHIAHSQMRPGDLVFFGSGSGIYHVGIYAGNGLMWDAPHSGTVVQRRAIWTSAYSVGRVA